MEVINNTRETCIYLDTKEYDSIIEHLGEDKKSLCVFFENDRHTLSGEVFKEFVCLSIRNIKGNIESYLSLNCLPNEQYFTFEKDPSSGVYLAYAKFSGSDSLKSATVMVEVTKDIANFDRNNFTTNTDESQATHNVESKPKLRKYK